MAGHTLAAEARLAEYLAEVSAGLGCGPWMRRRRIVAEIGEGVRDAAEASARHGVDADAALSAALDEFGPPEQIAAGFAPELTIAYARRTLAWYVATGPLVGIWWLMAGWPAHAGIGAAVAAIPVRPLIAAAIVTAAAVAAMTGRAMRWLPEARPRWALAAVAAVGAVVTSADMLMIASDGAALTRAGHTAALIAAAASLVRIGCTARVLFSLHRLRQQLAAADHLAGCHAGR
ncbi:HAAS signaling domain-containing protein [Hamadaea tsunoensis]|uniref:HAAS signaling domain-containing protein n=1 Tax=Hamadaea tsunoensis TaxID=53368 RepID=UPI0003FF400E|nr:hypothetical protein [Hamadaea tsunoensis]